MKHNKTLITETNIEKCYIKDYVFYYMVPWWTNKEYESCSIDKIPDWIIVDINSGVTEFICDIQVITDSIVIKKFYKIDGVNRKELEERCKEIEQEVSEIQEIFHNYNKIIGD